MNQKMLEDRQRARYREETRHQENLAHLREQLQDQMADRLNSFKQALILQKEKNIIQA